MAFSTPVIVANSDPVSGTSPRTLTCTGVPGRIYVATCGRYSAADGYNTFSDNGGNTWTRVDYAPKSGTTGRRVEIWVCVATNGFSQVTFTLLNTLYATVNIVEIQGGSGVIHAYNTDVRASSAGVTPPPVTITPTQANTMTLAWCQANPNNITAMSVAAPFTELDTGGLTQGPQVAYAYNLPTGSAVGAQFNIGTTTGNGHAIISFEEDATPPSSSPFTLWDGTNEQPLDIEGVWNGSAIVPVVFDQVYTTTPAPLAMLVGMDSLPANLAGDVASYPGIMYHRDFGVGNPTTPTPWNTGQRWAALPQGATMHISWKGDPTALTAFLDSIPDVPPVWFQGVYCSHKHEPYDEVKGGQYTAAQFRSYNITAMNIRNTHPKGHWILGMGPILTRYDLDEATPPADPAEYGWPGMDYYGVDCYWSKTSGGYPSTYNMFEKVFDLVLAAFPGIKLMVPEYGMVLQSGDSGTARASAITSHISYLRGRGDVLAIAYFNEIGSIPGVPLDDTPSADAWRAALASQ